MNVVSIEPRHQVRLLAAAIAIAGATIGCGSSSQTITSPSTVAKCAVTLEGVASTLPATGGTAQITVRTARECQWTAAAESPWLSIMSGGTGQGDGSVQVRATSNPDPVTRTGAVTANGQRAEVTQAAGDCRFDLNQSAASFLPAGGSGTIQVRASSLLCTWTAQSRADWISIRGGTNGKGTASVTYDVQPTSGPPRTGTIAIAGQLFSVTQSEGCTFAIAPTAHSASSAGGNGTIAVTAAPGCPWTAASNVDWVGITQGASGSGPGTVNFTVSPTNSTSRVGTVLVAGQTFSITQGEGCTYSISPTAQSVPSAGGSGNVAVSTASGCAWTASSNASWLTITGGASGAGNGGVGFSAAGTDGPGRSGSLTIAGQTFTVNQGQGCSFSISPESQSVPAGGGNGTVTVTAAEGCGWSASSNAPWITIGNPSNGNGNGQIRFSAAATNGPARSGTMTIAGRTFTVNQGQGCSASLDRESASHPAGGGSGEFRLSTPGGCGWNVSVEGNASWITLRSPANGSGDVTIRYEVAANSGGARSANIRAGGRTFRVDQAGGCAFGVAPATHDVGSGGGSVTVTITGDQSCGWTASSNAPWITIGSAPNGNGNGTVRLDVAANAEGPREGTASVAGQSVVVRQGGGCTIGLNPTEQNVPAAGAPGAFSISTAGSCAWAANPTVDWIAITSEPNGAGPATVQFAVAPNVGGARTGSISVSGQVFTIRQDGGCSITVAPEAIPAPAGGGAFPISVNGGPGCAWTAASDVPWIAIREGQSGSGQGVVQIDVQANAGAARTGTLSVAGRAVRVSQEGGCTYSLDQEFFSVGRDDGRRRVRVTTDGACGWSAVSNAPWIEITEGASGSGPGQVEFRFDRNNDGQTRTGTLTIAGRTVTIEQPGGGGGDGQN
jgi:hypothetical protein